MKLDKDKMTNVTLAGLEKIIAEAYALSRPQGLGFLHHKEGAITQDILVDVLSRVSETGHYALDMDYVSGRAVKLTVYRDDDGQLFIRNDYWFDHSEAQLQELLTRLAA